MNVYFKVVSKKFWKRLWDYVFNFWIFLEYELEEVLGMV